MTPSVQAIFEQVCDVVGDERQAELLRLCGSDVAVRAEVDSKPTVNTANGNLHPVRSAAFELSIEALLGKLHEKCLKVVVYKKADGFSVMLDRLMRLN